MIRSDERKYEYIYIIYIYTHIYIKESVACCSLKLFKILNMLHHFFFFNLNPRSLSNGTLKFLFFLRPFTCLFFKKKKFENFNIKVWVKST
jgi:hypothetical protein